MGGCQADQQQVKAKFQEPVVVAAVSPAFLSSKARPPAGS